MLYSSAAAAGLQWQVPGAAWRWVILPRRSAAQPAVHGLATHGALALALATPLLLAGPALGQQSITVGSGTSTTQLFELSTSGDRLTVEQTGTINRPASDAVLVTALGTISNAGSILGLIKVSGAGGLSLTNSGLIEGHQNAALSTHTSAITLLGGTTAGAHTITNSGTIDALSGAIFSVLSAAGPSSIGLTNSGTIIGGRHITNAGADVDAVRLKADAVTVLNTRLIRLEQNGSTAPHGERNVRALHIEATTALVRNEGSLARMEAPAFGLSINATGTATLDNLSGATLLGYGWMSANNEAVHGRGARLAAATALVTNAGTIGGLVTAQGSVTGFGLVTNGRSATIENQSGGLMAGAWSGVFAVATETVVLQNKTGGIIRSASSPSSELSSEPIIGVAIRATEITPALSTQNSGNSRTRNVWLVNDGIISFDTTTNVGGGVYIVAENATISNSGTMSARTTALAGSLANGLRLDARSVADPLANSGLISSFREADAPVNPGIELLGASGMRLQVATATAPLTISNSGTITGGNRILFRAGSAPYPVTVTEGSGALISATGNVTVVNSGTMATSNVLVLPSASASRPPIDFRFNGGGDGLSITSININTNTITNTNSIINSTVQLTNAGRISSSFSVTNPGSITYTYIFPNDVTNANAGTIRGGGPSGAFIRAPTVSVTNSGTIVMDQRMAVASYGLNVLRWDSVFIENQRGGLIASYVEDPLNNPNGRLNARGAIRLERGSGGVTTGGGSGTVTIINHAGARLIGGNQEGGGDSARGWSPAVDITSLFRDSLLGLTTQVTIRNSGTIQGGAGIDLNGGSITLHGAIAGSPLGGRIIGFDGPAVQLRSSSTLIHPLRIAQGAALIAYYRGSGLAFDAPRTPQAISNSGTILTIDAALGAVRTNPGTGGDRVDVQQITNEAGGLIAAARTSNLVHPAGIGIQMAITAANTADWPTAVLRVCLESHAERATRRSRMMTEAA